MLSIEARPYSLIDDSKDLIKYPGAVFDAFYDDDWLDDPFARKIITDIQCMDVMDTSRHTEEILAGYGLPVKKLANGTKNLLVCKNYDTDKKCRLAMMGPNCFKWLMDIAETKDICGIITTVVVFKDSDLKGRPVFFVDTGVTVTTEHDFKWQIIELAAREAWHYDPSLP